MGANEKRMERLWHNRHQVHAEALCIIIVVSIVEYAML